MPRITDRIKDIRPRKKGGNKGDKPKKSLWKRVRDGEHTNFIVAFGLTIALVGFILYQLGSPAASTVPVTWGTSAYVNTSVYLDQLKANNIKSLYVDEEAGTVTAQLRTAIVQGSQDDVTSIIAPVPAESKATDPTYLASFDTDMTYTYSRPYTEDMSRYVRVLVAAMVACIGLVAFSVINTLYWRKRMRSMEGMGGGVGGGPGLPGTGMGGPGSNRRIIRGRGTGMEGRFNVEIPDASFDDVAGIPEPIEEISELVTFLKDPGKYAQAGAVPPHGILLQGPPGTGKTALSRALAGEAGVSFIPTSGSQFMELFVGVGAMRVRELFQTARDSAPAIIFIDEIDAIGGRREGAFGMGANDERVQTINQLLAEMDGFKPSDGIIVLAATNLASTLDQALLRPGRFDRIVSVNPPNKEGRAEILRLYAQGRPFAMKLDFDWLASRTYNFTGAQLKNLMNEASVLAVRRSDEDGKEPAITYDDLLEAADRVVAGPALKSRKLMESEKRQVAFHEAGHAIVSHILPLCDPIQKISIVSRSEAMGYVQYYNEDDSYITTADKFKQTLSSLLGGRVSERMFCGVETSGASNDLERASQLAYRIVDEFAMNGLGGKLRVTVRDETTRAIIQSPQRAQEVDDAVEKLLRDAEAVAIKVLEENRGSVERIVAVLMEDEVIEGSRVNEILREDGCEVSGNTGEDEGGWTLPEPAGEAEGGDARAAEGGIIGQAGDETADAAGGDAAGMATGAAGGGGAT